MLKHTSIQKAFAFIALIAGTALVVSPMSTYAVGGSQNAVQVAQATPSLSTLVAAVTAADLATALSTAPGTAPAPYTLFAPNNDAFAALGSDILNTLLAPQNKTLLQDVLKYHVIPNTEISAAAAISGAPSNPTTLQGGTIAVTSTGPTNVTLNGNTTVILKDVAASNATIHVIDKVLLSSALSTQVTTAVNTYKTTRIPNIATANASTSTLVSLLTATDLVTPLTAAGPFTVFAPTNDAFNALGKETLDVLALPQNKTLLADILKYHVVAGSNLVAADLIAGTPKEVTSLQGDKIKVTSTGPTNVTLNDNNTLAANSAPSLLAFLSVPVYAQSAGNQGAVVSQANVAASNGTIHLINRVIVSQGLAARLNAAVLAQRATLTRTGDNMVLLPIIGASLLLLAGTGFFLLKRKNA